MNSWCGTYKTLGAVLFLQLVQVCLCAPSSAQQPIDKLVNVVKAQHGNTRIAFIKAPASYAEYLAAHGVQQDVSSLVEQQHLDKQVGGTSSSGSGTSAVSTGSVPWLFGFAVEHGALTQSVDNNTITFRGNVANVIKALKVKDYIQSYRTGQDNMFVRNVSKLSFSASFNASQAGTGTSQASGTGSTTNTTGQKNTLAGYSFHFDIYNRRDPRDKKWDSDWAALVGPQLQSVVNGWGSFDDLIDRRPAEKSQWEAYIDQQLNQFPIDTNDDKTIQSANCS